MMWFKETYRALAANSRLSLTEQGALWNICRFAWERQGIAETDLFELSRALREPVELLRQVWPDFAAIAEEKDGKWMLAEQREGAEKYHQKREIGKEMAKRRWEASENDTFTENKDFTGTVPNTDLHTVPNTDKIRLDKIPTVLEKEYSSVGGAGGEAAKSQPSPKRKKSLPKLTDDEWLDSLQKNPAYSALPVRMSYGRALVWCEVNQRQCTRRFFINWLNRERPVSAATSHNAGGTGKVVL